MAFARLNSFLNWSVRVGRLFGIPISLHITLIFFLWPVLSGSGLGPWYSLEYAVLIVLSILAHELGHALTARRFRLTGLSIMLHGFGGFAVSSGYRTPAQQLIISLAGPAVTFILGGIAWGLGSMGLSTASFGTALFFQLYILKYVGIVNLMLGVLNLLPSLPFDGGHALQAILARKQSDFKAMRTVAHIGLVITPILLIYCFLTDRRLALIFALIGLLTSLGTLLQTGGIRFGEMFADRRERKDREAAKKRERAKTEAYLSDVASRQRQREERERLRKLLESSLDDE
jgi:Zn-dependent protease